MWFITKKRHERIVQERETAVHRYKYSIVRMLTEELLRVKNPQMQRSFAGSSNGRTAGLEPVNRGSNP
jgi:hypothetical protein